MIKQLLFLLCVSLFPCIIGADEDSWIRHNEAWEHFIESRWDRSILDSLSQNKRKVGLSDCIPPELQNLSYATYPTSADYNTARLIFNKRFVYFPKAIIAPATFDEARYVLSIFKQYDLNFSIRSGGHCFEPGSLSSNFVFDLSKFNSILPNPSLGEVYIGAGAKLQDVISTLGAIDYAIPTGTCPGVGVTGLTLGGGIGLLVRKYGLTCDSVKSITFLNAEAQVIEVNATNYPDLFWALLGGGNGSFGIVLGFTFQMYYIPSITYYEMIWEWDPKLIPPIFHAWQKWIKTLPDEISSVLGIRHPNDICALPEGTPPLVIRIFGLKTNEGPFNEWEKAFDELKPQIRTFTGSYLDISKYWASQPALPFNKAKSRILMRPMNNQAIKQVTRFFNKIEKKNPDILVYFNFERLGGAVKDNDTAFYAREAFGWWFQAYYWGQQNQNEKVLALSRQFYQNIPSGVSKYCYPNIVDYDLGKRYLKLYYGNHVKRLMNVKDRYDPTNLFHWKQSIPNH